MPDSRTSRASFTLVFGLTVLAYVALGALARYFENRPGHLSDIWWADALATAVALRLPLRQIWQVLAAALCGAVIIALLYAPSLPIGSVFVLASLVGIALPVALLHFLMEDGVHVHEVKRFIQTLGAVMLAGALPSALVGAACFSLVRGDDFENALRHWFLSRSIGMLGILPLVMASDLRVLLTPRLWRLNPAVLLFLLVSLSATALALQYYAYPFIVISLPLTLAAFQLDLAGVGLLGLANTILMSALSSRPAHAAWAVAGGEPQILSLSMGLALVPPLLISVLVFQRNHKERQYRESAERFENTMRFSVIGIGLVTRQGHILQANQSLQSMLGYTGAPPVHLSIWQMVHHESRLALLELVEQVASGQVRGASRELQYERGDGITAWANWVLSAVHDEHGVFSHFIVQTIDIDSRKRVELALEDSERRWKFALESSGQGVVDWDMLSDRLYFSPAWRNMLGYGYDDLAETEVSWRSCIHADDLPIVMAEMIAHQHGVTPELISEHRLRCKDGSYKWVSLRGKVILRGPGGQPWRMILTYIDVTHSHESRLALQRSEAMLAQSSKLARLGAWELDLTSKQVTWSEGMFLIFDMQPGRVPDVTESLALFADTSRSDMEAALAHAMQTGRGWNMEVEVVTALGRSVWIRSLGQADLVDGKPVRLWGVIQDISESKAIELLKGQFVATVSHELRTPLTSLRGALRLLQNLGKASLAPPLQEMLTVADRNCDRLIMLVNDILDFEKLNAGKLELHVECVDIATLVRQAVETNQMYATQFNVSFAVDLPEAPVYAQADAARLTQVMANLLSNAAKFSKTGSEVHVRMEPDVRAERDEDDGPGWRICVTDQGAGIPEAFRHRIFQPFSQADSSDQRQKGGTGLGLAISHTLVAGMGGEIGFDSPPGAGATFYVRLAPCQADATVN